MPGAQADTADQVVRRRRPLSGSQVSRLPAQSNDRERFPPAPLAQLPAAAGNGPTDLPAGSTRHKSLSPRQTPTQRIPASEPPALQTVAECTAVDTQSAYRSTGPALPAPRLPSADADQKGGAPGSRRSTRLTAGSGQSFARSWCDQIGPCCNSRNHANLRHLRRAPVSNQTWRFASQPI